MQKSQSWADYVQRVLDAHGTTLRSQRHRTGISHSTIMGWLQGIKPTMEGAITFARGFGEDANAALAIAGYDPIVRTGPEVYREGLEALERKLGRAILIQHDEEAFRRLTVEQAYEDLAQLWKDAEEGLV